MFVVRHFWVCWYPFKRQLTQVINFCVRIVLVNLDSLERTIKFSKYPTLQFLDIENLHDQMHRSTYQSVSNIVIALLLLI